MTSTPNAKAATAVRVAGFLALLTAGAALLVLFAAAAHAALGTSSPKAEHAVNMHRPGAAPHLRHQHSGLRKDAARPGHQVRAHLTASGRSGQMRPAHSGSHAELVSLKSNHKTAAVVRAARHGHTETASVHQAQFVLHIHGRSNSEHIWQL